MNQIPVLFEMQQEAINMQHLKTTFLWIIIQNVSQAILTTEGINCSTF